MTENDKVNTEGDSGSSTNTESTGGEVVSTSNDKKETEGKTFNQIEVDRILKSAKEDAKKSAKKEFEKQLEGKKVLTDDDLTKLRDEWLNEYKAEQTLLSVKAAIKQEYGLTDVQVERISGEDEKSLRADAELLFGSLKKKDAPNLSPGISQKNNKDDIDMLLEKGLKNARSR